MRISLPKWTKPRILSLLVIAVVFAPAASVAKGVRGYTKKNGTYVAPHQKTDPNKTKVDNYSTKGNSNPYTGEKGTKDPYAPSK